MSDFPKFVEFREEGPREGFQIEKKIYPIEKFNMTMYKTSLSSAGSICDLLGGEVDESTGECEVGLQIHPFKCPSGQAIVSLDATTKEPTCAPVPVVPSSVSGFCGYGDRGSDDGTMDLGVGASASQRGT